MPTTRGEGELPQSITISGGLKSGVPSDWRRLPIISGRATIQRLKNGGHSNVHAVLLVLRYRCDFRTKVTRLRPVSLRPGYSVR